MGPEKKALLKTLVSAILSGAMLGSVVAVDKASRPSDAVTAIGSAEGMEGSVVVAVSADNENIYSITVTEQNETPGIGSVAVEKLPGQIVENQSLRTDSIAGCTVTSEAIKKAARSALESAGIDTEVFDILPGYKNRERKEEILECDVVVVGAGGAGLTAAAQAAEEGSKVIVLEKMPAVGGNTLKATGGMNAAGTKYQEELGITGSGVNEFIEDTMNGGHKVNDRKLVTTMAEKSSGAIEWLKSIGAPLPKVVATGGTAHKYLHEPEDGSAAGPYLVEKLNAYVKKLGVEVKLETTATKIIMDGDKAAGVKAESADTDYTINAKAVILATGGFGANYAMMIKYNKSLSGAVTANHKGASGDGITMATAVGADTVDMNRIQLHPTVYQKTGLLVSESVRSMGGILVNSSGKRFCNDMSTRDVVSAAELEQDGSYAYIIFDQRVVDSLISCQKYISNGLTVQADTYEELAELMGLEGEALTDFPGTMEKWNESVAKGTDEEFGRRNGIDEDLSAAPYYAIKIAPGIHHTMGGIKINTGAQVLKTDGKPIPGLFAAGETVGGVHGANRIGGNAVCDIVVFGRISGTNASKYAKENQGLNGGA